MIDVNIIDVNIIDALTSLRGTLVLDHYVVSTLLVIAAPLLVDSVEMCLHSSHKHS